MAEKSSALLESYLSCHVCSDTFRDPVCLCCNHSFCSSCLQTFWEQAGNKYCPICERKPLTDDPDVNFTLKELADSFAERLNTGPPMTEKGEKQVEVKEEVVGVRTSRELCVLSEFSLHQNHKVVPVEKTVSELKSTIAIASYRW